MKPVLQYIYHKLSLVALVIILGYIGYCELFRKSSINLTDELNEGLQQNKLVRSELRAVANQLKQQGEDLQDLEVRTSLTDYNLGVLSDTISAISGRYKVVRSQLNQQLTTGLERYQQQKKAIQDIQKQLQ